MVVYIVVGVVVLLVLVLAYRSLGGATAHDVDSAALLRTAAAALAASLDGLAALVADSPIAATTREDADRGSALRRQADGAAQLLERCDGTTLPPDVADAHALLIVAAQEASWAARLASSPQYAGASGMHDAARTLVAHANRCRTDAVALLGGSAVAEEGDRAAHALVE